MKTLIVYYSFTGHTDRVANIFADVLKGKGEVVLQRLKPNPEPQAFGAQCRAAFTGQKPALKGNVNYDVSSYDLVIIGCPVWAFAPVPAMNTFLSNMKGISGKKSVVLLTSGSGLGVNRCFKNIERLLESKGAPRIDRINIPDRMQGDGEFIANSIRKLANGK